MITVETKQKRYNVVLENSFNSLAHHMLKLFKKESRIFIVTDDTIMPLYCEKVLETLKGAYNHVLTTSLKHGEENKNLDAVTHIYKILLENGADRSSVIIALGGGVIGDIAGFAASTYMRGIYFVQLPTTLLSMVDSSVGGKTGVDFLGYKNIVGAFYQPDLVYINTNALTTLPKRQLAAGMAEVLKYGFIMDKDFFNFVTENANSTINSSVLISMIEKSIKFKASIVRQDENEKDIREILNFGHTIGHAIESVFNFRMLHGECVALGMICALKISKGRHGFTDNGKYMGFLEKMELPKKIKGITNEQLINAMKKDKKNKMGKISFVLLNEIGNAYSASDVTSDEVITSLKVITEIE